MAGTILDQLYGDGTQAGAQNPVTAGDFDQLIAQSQLLQRLKEMQEKQDQAADTNQGTPVPDGKPKVTLPQTNPDGSPITAPAPVPATPPPAPAQPPPQAPPAAAPPAAPPPVQQPGFRPSTVAPAYQDLPRPGFMRQLSDNILQASGVRVPDRAAQSANYQFVLSRTGDAGLALAAAQNPVVMNQILPRLSGIAAPNIQKMNPDERLVITPPGGQPYVAIGGADESNKTVAGRTALANKYNLQPGSPQYKDYVLTGKLPEIVPDRKAIQESDSKVLASNKMIEALDEALAISPNIWGAGMSHLAPAMNFVGGTQGSRETDHFNNLVQGAVLPTMRTNFPGRITNTDLLLIQRLAGSASMPQELRDQVLKDAKNRALELRAEQIEEAKQLREGTFYQPGGGIADKTSPGDKTITNANAPPATPPAPPAAPPAQGAAAPGGATAGAPFKVGNKTYQRINGQLYELGAK